MNKDDQNRNLNKASAGTNSKNANKAEAEVVETIQQQKSNNKNKKNNNNNNNNSLKLAAATAVAATIATIATTNNNNNNSQNPQQTPGAAGNSSKKSSRQGNAAAAGRQNSSSSSSVSSASVSNSNSFVPEAITPAPIAPASDLLDNGVANLANVAARLKNTNSNNTNSKIKLKVNNNTNSIATSSSSTTSSSSAAVCNTAHGNKMSKTLNTNVATANPINTKSAATTTATMTSSTSPDIDVGALSVPSIPSSAVTSTATGTVPTITSSKSSGAVNSGVAGGSSSGGGNSSRLKKSSSAAAAAAALALQQQAAAVSTGKSALSSVATSAKGAGSSKDAHLKFTSALPLLVGSAAAAAAAAKGAGASSSAGAQAAAAAAVALKQKLKSAAAASSVAAAGNSRSNSTSTSSNSSSLSSSVGIVNAISNALQNIITSDNSDTDTELYPPQVTDLSESDEESVSEILLACLCLRPDLLDDIPESDPDSCGHDAEGHDEEDDGDDEDEDEEDEEDEEDDEDENEDDDDDDDDDEEDEEEEIDDDDDDEEIQDPNEVSGDFLLDANNDRSRNLNALFEAAANEKAPVLRHATHAIDETKQALTKMRGASSDKTMFSRTLIAACNDNDVNTVRSLLGKGNVNINESTDDGESLLSMACSAGYYELAQVLLAMSAAQVEDKGQKDCTPLMEAASAGHLEIVKLLLSHNADVNAHCATSNTPLMFACAGGHVEVVKELLKHGANVEEQNENGHTPLMEAASAGHVEVAKVLLEHGAGINTHSNEFKESALTLACYKGHLNMVRFLLQAGADQEHKTDEMHTALMEASMDGHVEVARLLLDSGAQVNMPTDSFESPLTLAACGGHVELATLLIERGANIEEVNDEGFTPLMEAAREGHEEMVALLLSKGANINATTEETQETALTLACCGGCSEVAEYLIKHGANLELGASTPLMEAAQEGHTDLVRFLLENKANVHAETQTGDTALTHACENGHTDAAEVLLSYGAELEHESEGGRTPLMKACRAGHLCTVKFLISKGADVNKQTSSNDHTPLSLACAGGHQAVVEYLLKSGADPFHKLKDNSTMLIEAAKGGHTRVVELLFKYPHFIQNHQNDLQSAAAAAAAANAAAAVGINNTTSNAAANQLHLINLQKQKQLQQQLQLQLQQLSAPPSIHDVSEAVRTSNTIFHQQPYISTTGAEYLEDQLQLVAPSSTATTTATIAPSNDVIGSPNQVACNEEYAAIDINSLSAQQQEALIAKSRLFHLQAGFGNVAGGNVSAVTNSNESQQQQHNNSLNNQQQRKHFDLDMSHIMPLTPPQKQPPAPPVLQSQQLSQTQQQNNQSSGQQQQQPPPPQQQQPPPPQQQIKVKGNQRKNRQQPPQPFEVNLPTASTAANATTTTITPTNNNNSYEQHQLQLQQQIQDVERSQPLGDDGLGNKPQQQQQQSLATSKQQFHLSCFSDEGRLIRRRVLRQDFNKMSNDQKNLAATLLPATYLEMAGSAVNTTGQNVGDGADDLTLNQNVLAVGPGSMGDGSEMQPVIIASPEPLNFASNQALMMQELFDPNNPQTPLTLATTFPQGAPLVLAQAPTPQQQQTLQQPPQPQQQRILTASGKTTQKTGGITTPSEVSQSTAISDRPKAKPVSKKDGKMLRKTCTQSTAAVAAAPSTSTALHQPQQPLFRQNQMVSIYNNLPMLITNESTPSIQTQHAIMNHMVFAAQQQQQPHISLDVSQQGVIALSNSPASPLASPSSGSVALYNPQQQQQQLQQLMELQSAEQQQQQNQELQQHPESEQTAQEIQEALDAALSDSKMAVTESLNVLSKANAAAAAAAVAKACGLNPAEQQECLKKLQEGWQIVDLRQRIFHKQPKSPTETPPEKQLMDGSNIESVDMVESHEIGDTNNEMKNLATLCTAAAQAAAANVASISDGVNEGNKTELSNNAIVVGSGSGTSTGQPLTRKQRKLSKKEKLAQQEAVAAAATAKQLQQESERRNSVDDHSLASEECLPEDETNSDVEQQQHQDEDLKAIHEFDDNEDQLKSPSKGLKPISQRLENLILSNATLKPGDLSQAFTDLRHEIGGGGSPGGSDVLTLFPQNMNLKFSGNTALSNALQQHFAAVKQEISGVTTQESGIDGVGSDMLQGAEANIESNSAHDNELVFPSAMDAETLEQFANSAANMDGTNGQDDQQHVVGSDDQQVEEGMREEMYDIEVEMDEFFHVIHNVHDPALQEFASNLNCGELTDFGINSICKSRWNGNWALTPKWTSQDHLISAAAAAHHQQQQQQGLLTASEEDDQQQQQEQQRQANQLLLDYQLQQQLQQRFADADEMQMQQHQQTTLSLIPFSPEDAAAAAVQQQQLQPTLPTSSQDTVAAEYHLQQQHQHLGLDHELKQHIQQLQQRQQTNVRLLKAVAAAAANQQQQQSANGQQQQQNIANANANFVFNVDGNGGAGVTDKSSQSLQLLFQLPPAVQQQQQDQDQLEDEVAATAQQLQHLKLHHQELQDQKKQQQQQLKLLQQEQQMLQDLSQAENLIQQQQQDQLVHNQQQHQQQSTLEQVAHNNLLLQQQAALAQQVLSQQVLKQKQQQLLLQQQQQQQQSTQVQVATQTQPSVVVPHPNAAQGSRGVNQFCPIAASVDLGLGSVSALTPQQLQQQQQQQQQHQSQQQQMAVAAAAAAAAAVQQQQQPQIPAPAPLSSALTQVAANSSVVPTPQASTSSGSSKIPGGIAKKVIDKQSRKERNRYSLLRTAAGSQANAVAQQQYQQTVAASTTLDKTIDVDTETDSNHDTALTLACAGGHEELVELLINRGANIEHRDKKGFTPLILAATAGHEKVVDILLNHRADLEAQSERTKDTPLSLACSGGRYEVVELLLARSANKEHRNVSDYTPLSLAASGGYVNIIKLLLSNGAEINSRTGSKLGISPLMLAAMNGHAAAVKLLLDQGSDINAQIETNRNTALTLACFQGRHDVVSLLLDRKANVEHRAKTGLTPLMEAASGGYIEVGRVLLDKGADVNAAPVPTSRDTALTIAADKGHLKFVELLLSRGAAVEVKNKKGNSPLWLAAHGGHLSVVEILYDHRADIDSQDNRRVSCLMAAFRKGHTKVVKWMVQYVTQFPSDQEMNRFISTISDKELSEKCYDCMKIIRAAKEAQAVKANKNASILLEELDMERTREESRRAAAARRRERKKKKKMEKKEEKRRQMEEATGGPGKRQHSHDDDKDSDKEDDSDQDDNNGGGDYDDDQQNPQNYREEGDSGIDQGSCSSTDIKGAGGGGGINQSTDKTAAASKNKNKKKNKQQPQQSTRNSSPVIEEPPQPPLPAVPISSANKQQQQQKKRDENTPSIVKASANSKKSQEANTLAAKSQTVSNNSANKKLEGQHKKEDAIISGTAQSGNQGKNKKDFNKQKEKENLAPKELAAAGTALQQQQTPVNITKLQQQTHSQQQPIQQQIKVETAVGNRKSLIFSAGKTSDDKRESEIIFSGATTTAKAHSHATTAGTTNVAPKRGEDGWKEVVRKSSAQQSSTAVVTSSATTPSSNIAAGNNTSSSTTSTTSSSSSSTSSSTCITVPGVSTTTTVTSTMPEVTCKKVQVPVNAISRVIGRAGSNINAIRATTGAHIEVEKQGKNQSERSITIKGLTEATKQAHMLILALIKDPDVDILQMLPRINTTIKANIVPPAATTPPSSTSTSIATMQVGTWDNKTALQANSLSSAGQQNMSSGSSTASSVSSNPGNIQNTQGPNSKSSSNNTNAKTNAKMLGVTTNAAKSSAASRTQPTKPFYSQQSTSTRGSSSGVGGTGGNCAGTLAAKHKDTNPKVLSSTTYNSSQKSAPAQPGKVSAINNQTFAAKLLTGATSSTSSVGNMSPTKKSELGGLQRPGITAPYGRGKPVPSSTISGSGHSNSGNTLSGPIGTFNVAEAAAAVAAANAAAAAANNNVSGGNVARSVTPIGPPNKQRAPTPTTQSVGQHHNSHAGSLVMPGASQSSQTLHINTGSMGNDGNIPPPGSSSMAPSGSFGSQLTSKISSEYSLFNDYHQTQWGTPDTSQVYTNPNPMVNDNLPQADASKAPGYNRNILSSPVGNSKASSCQSTTPPGTSNLNMVGTQQTLTILPESGVAPIGSAVQNARSPGAVQNISGGQAGSEISPSSSSANQQQHAASSQQGPSDISPGVIKPPTGTSASGNQQQQSNQNSGNSQASGPPSGLAIQRPNTCGQHRTNAPNNNSSQQQSPPSNPSNVGNDNAGTQLNFGPIGSNATNRSGNPPGAIGEQARFYDPTTQLNVAAQMGFPMDPLLLQQQVYNANSARINPRSSVFGGQQHAGNKAQPPQPMGSGMYHQSQPNQSQQPNGPQQQQGGGNAFNAAPGKPHNPAQNMAPQRPQSQPQAGQTQNQRWYADYAAAGGYVPPSTRDILNLENGSSGPGTNSPAAMSPNQSGAANANNASLLLQTPPQLQAQQQSAEDMRKMPRPIGTERASWKYNNYPNMSNMGMGIGGLAGAVSLNVDDTLAAMTAAATGMPTGPGGGMPSGPMPPWLLGAAADKQAAAAAVQQQQQQQANWMKQQYRYYGGAGAAGAGSMTGIGGPADYHHQQDQYHQMALDYHNTMPPPNLNQNQQMNLIHPYTTYPHFMGHVGGNDMSHMPDKIELWDHHDKHTWASNWTN